MIVKVMKRCTGKTTELIKISHKTGYRIITSSFARAKNIEFAAKRMKLDIPDPVSFAIYMLPNRKECIRRKEDRRYFLGGCKCKVIGNIYDNPELLGGDTDA